MYIDNEKEELLKEYVKKHEEGTCNCNEDNLELCLGGNYLNDNLSKQEIFEGWD